MSIDCFWVATEISGEQYARILPRFRAAEQAARSDARVAAAIAAWRAHPERFDLQGAGDPHPLVHDFIGGFLVPEFAELGEEFYTESGLFADVTHLDDRSVLIDSVMPAAVLWHALGPERAARLPGRMGNLLVAPDQAAAVADQVAATYDDLDLSMAAARGCQLSHDTMEADQCLQILRMMPEGLRRAREAGMGFIALGTTLS